MFGFVPTRLARLESSALCSAFAAEVGSLSWIGNSGSGRSFDLAAGFLLLCLP
jgi:hypothetical protein